MTGLSTAGVTAISTRVGIRTEAAAGFAVWQASLTRAAGAAPGFVNIEIAPAFLGSSDWQIVQRFQSADLLILWRASPTRAKLFADLAALQTPALAALQDEAAPDVHALYCVTEVITTVVAPGKEEIYRTWTESVQAAQATFPGYMGTLVQAPLSADIPYWTTLVRFATTGELDAWLGSAQRKAIIDSAAPDVSTWKSQRINGAFEGWFASNSGSTTAPAAWKQTALVLLVLFPVVMLEIKFLSPYLAGLHVTIATFIGNAISVSLVSWPLMNVAVAGLGWWLRPAPARRLAIETAGACVVLALYASEILGFSLLF
ncbi:antibiotic biosynthesis monooxygenase [Beijerinckia sp. L45]|uniref:antibiotic biosynthesis monooxygenase n=1 Tax=Beijerinckia sp. L45 TaxID=1641855 RepID=UPI00131E669C|nr:antibiotic biosynthesis monooxygenase [Beijerinckia sp. L45]